MEEKIRDLILDFFISQGKFQGKSTGEMCSVNFIESNTLDSIEFITLISEIEENFNILFTQEDLQSEQFTTIDGITALARARLRP